MAEPLRVLALVARGHRMVYRWPAGREDALLVALLNDTRKPDHPLLWSDVLPVLVRLRDLARGDGPNPLILEAPNA